MSTSEKNIKNQWENIKSNIQQVIEEVLRNYKRQAKKEWITDKILKMMEDKRLTKGNIQKYNKLYSNIRCKIQEEKHSRMTEQCREAKELYAKHDSYLFHRKLKEKTNTFKKTNISKITKKITRYSLL